MAETVESGDWKIRYRKDGIQLLAKQLGDLTPLMEQIGVYLKAVSLVAFANQRFDGVRWPARRGSAARPSVMGAVQDLAEGPEIHPSRFTDRPALVDTGALRRSLRAIATAKTVRMTSTSPYAQLHQEGGLSILPVTRAVTRNLATLLRAQPALRPGLGFLFRKFEVEATVPARPFLGVPEASKPKIQQLVREYLDGLKAPEEV